MRWAGYLYVLIDSHWSVMKLLLCCIFIANVGSQNTSKTDNASSSKTDLFGDLPNASHKADSNNMLTNTDSSSLKRKLINPNNEELNVQTKRPFLSKLSGTYF